LHFFYPSTLNIEEQSTNFFLFLDYNLASFFISNPEGHLNAIQ